MDTPAVVGASAVTLKMMDGCKGSGGSSGPPAAAAMLLWYVSIHEDWSVLEWCQSSPLAQRSVNGIPIVRIYGNCAHDIPRWRWSDAWFCSLASVVDEADLVMDSEGDTWPCGVLQTMLPGEGWKIKTLPSQPPHTCLKVLSVCMRSQWCAWMHIFSF